MSDVWRSDSDFAFGEKSGLGFPAQLNCFQFRQWLVTPAMLHQSAKLCCPDAKEAVKINRHS